MERAVESARLAADIIRHIREFVQKGEPTRTLVDLNHAVGNVVALATPEVLGQLNETGIEGLKTFGYEPWERPEDQTIPVLSTSCDLEACTDWTAPPSLITLLTRRNRIKEREAMAQAFVNKRMIRKHPEGKKALNARERLYQARHPEHRRQDALQERKNKIREREDMMRRNHNTFRLHVPGLGG